MGRDEVGGRAEEEGRGNRGRMLHVMTNIRIHP